MVEDLIYDVGLHKGEDTAYYLAKGYRVVAFEADPGLVASCRVRFADAIARGRLQLVEGAITDRPGDAVSFYRHTTKSDWGTLDESWAARNLSLVTDGTIERVEVAATDFAASLEATGVPYFMKIDVEGADRLCLRTLLRFEARPAFVSIESSKTDFDQIREELDLLVALGYKRFAAVQQETIPGSTISTTDRAGKRMTYRFDTHSSGGFGLDIDGWQSREAVERRYRRIFTLYRLFGDRSPIRAFRIARALNAVGRLTPFALPGWYDTHASLE